MIPFFIYYSMFGFQRVGDLIWAASDMRTKGFLIGGTAGKTTLADEMAPLLNAKRLNADEVRKAANDWDFSEEGRVRQAKRMAEAALKLKAENHHVIADFIAPTPEARSLFPADFRVWVDTIKEGRFEDTNLMFVNPKNFDFHVTTQDAKNWAPKIVEEIKK